MDLLPSGSYDKHTKIWSGPAVEPLFNLEHYSVGQILFGQMRIYPNNVIQIDDVEQRSVTNREALTWAIRLAQHFKKMNLRYDNIVGISAQNSTYVMPVALGCFLNGVPFHAVNPQLDEKSLAHCFDITKPTIIFCDGLNYDKIRLATKSYEPLIYTLSEHLESVASISDLLEPTKTEFYYQPEKLTLGSNQTIAVVCSSGTTGLPKAVTLSVRAVFFNNPLLTSEDVVFSCSNLGWITNLMGLIFCSYMGCTRIITRKPFSPEYFIELNKKYKITNVHLSPCEVVALTEYPDFTRENLASVKSIQTGGSSISKKTLAKFQNILPHCLICYGYGLSEVGGVTGKLGLGHENSVGKLQSNLKLQIVNKQGKNLGPNEEGEIQVFHPYHWAGYYDNPLETQRMRDSLGWFHTGDLGYMDDDGHLYVVDRTKDICKYLGHQYWPSEIEHVILELRDVVDCCVVGIFDERFGDVAGALVIKAKDSPMLAENIIDYVKERLQVQHKQLHNGVVFVDQIPQNFNGKKLKAAAKEMFQKL